MNKTTSKRGFTIIEVVLVLAIAALIFMMVFLAWPALQRNQRDDARRRDAGTVASAIGTYKSNNANKLPPVGSTEFQDDFVAKYLVDELAMYNKSDGTKLVPSATANPTSVDPAEDQMYVIIGKGCDSDDSKSRTVAIVVSLENSKDTHCTEA